jgi:nucleoside-diphosphate-sugar epimerase
MRVFVTGASGFIGSAVVPELIAAGHEVTGLAHSGSSAAALEAAGAQVHPGDLCDRRSLRAAADAADGVIHLAFSHDSSDAARAALTDLRAIEALADALEDSGRPLVIASGVIGRPSRVATEQDPLDRRSAAAAVRPGALALYCAHAPRGIRSSIVRLAPLVHDAQSKRGFAGRLVDIARLRGVSGYVGDGSNRWPAVHRLDAARLFRLALEKAPSGSVLHGVAEAGVPTRDIAEAIGRYLNLPTASIPAEQAVEHFGWLAAAFAADIPASNTLTCDMLGWQPSHPRLVHAPSPGIPAPSEPRASRTEDVAFLAPKKPMERKHAKLRASSHGVLAESADSSRPVRRGRR